MASINRGRFVLAGLAAGVVMNVISLLSWGLYAQEMLVILKSRGIEPPYLFSTFNYGWDSLSLVLHDG